jgi:hypothetical protein
MSFQFLSYLKKSNMSSFNSKIVQYNYKNKGFKMKNIIYLSLVLLLFGCSSLKNNSIDKIENL